MGGERITPARLHALGVVNRLTAAGGAFDAALELAGKLNERAPNVLASLKELLADAAGSSFSTQLAAERDHFVRNLHHPNGGAGIAAFLAKQSPRYQ
jgi:enoyl-CoA hydratase/carnithine racemase